MKKSILKRIFFIAVIAVILVYFGVMLFRGRIATDDMIDTEIATRYSYSENITTDSTIVRNESLLTYNGSKVLYYTVNDGDIVSVDSEVALVFANESDALNYNRINDISKQIEILESLNTSNSNIQTDFSAIDKQIELNLKNMITAVNTHTPSKIISSGDNLVYSINQRQIITGEVENFDEQIAKLNSELKQYQQSGGTYTDVIKTNASGYFVASADGYENVFDYDKVTELTVEDLSAEHKPQAVSEGTIGKIVSGLNWYVVCKLSADEALTLSHSNQSIYLTFPNTTCTDIPATLVALNQTSKQSDAVAVFRCNYMNTPISHLRNERVQISVNAYSGIRISKEALHDDYIEITGDDNSTVSKEKVQGVYVLHGNELEFKEVSILFAGPDFLILDENPDSATLVSGETVKLNDEIVVKGEDLYDGKDVK